MTATISPIQNALDQYEERIGGKFKPNERFYKKVGINQKRFGQLIRGEKPIFGFEAQNLASFFGKDMMFFLIH